MDTSTISLPAPGHPVTTSENFNIFRILGKDDKELIHSAFIKFLLEEETDAFCNHFGIKIPEIKEIQLEKRCSLPKNFKKRKRIITDIEATGLDGKPILIIENKFKSFPYKEQLELYDLAYSNSSVEIIKLLFCFDPDLIPFKEEFKEWKFLGYERLVEFVQKLLMEEGAQSPDKKMFLQHYHSFLQAENYRYAEFKNNCRLLLEQPQKKEHKFPLQLMNCALVLRLNEREEVPCEYRPNPKNTKTPVLNILPKQWKRDKWELLIQVQNGELKLYMHFLNEWRNLKDLKNTKSFPYHEEKRKFLLELRSHILNTPILNKKGIRSFNEVGFSSCYLYKEKLLSRLPEEKAITTHDIADVILDFLNEMDIIVQDYLDKSLVIEKA